MSVSGVAAATDLATTYLVVTNRVGHHVSRYDAASGEFLGHLGEIVPSTNLEAIVFGPDQNLYVATGQRNSVYRYNGSTGEFKDTFVDRGVSYAAGLAFAPDGDLLVSSYLDDSVQRFDGATGDRKTPIVASGAGGLDGPVYLLVDPQGDLLVGSQNTNEILRYDLPSGEFLGAVVRRLESGTPCPQSGVLPGEGGLCAPWGIAVGPDENLYVSSVLNDRILRYDLKTGEHLGEFVPEGYGGLHIPTEIAFYRDSMFVGSWTGSAGAVLEYDAHTGAFQGVFASDNMASVHGVLFYRWESELSPTGKQASIASDRWGRRVVTWTDRDDDGAGVLAQVFDAAGRSIGPPFTVNATESGSQHSPQVDCFPNGGFAVIWLSDRGFTGVEAGDRLMARVFTPTGVPLGGEIEVSAAQDAVIAAPALAVRDDRVAAAWERRDSGRIRGRIIGPDGRPLGPEFAIDGPGTGFASAPALTWHGRRLVAVWITAASRERARTSGLRSEDATVDFCELDELGEPTTGGTIGASSGSDPGNPDVDTAGGDDVVVVWDGSGADDDRSTINGVIGDLTDLVDAEPFLVPSDATRDARTARIASAVDGSFIVTWESADAQAEAGVFARPYSADGLPTVTDIVVVDSAGDVDYGSPDVSIDDRGEVTVVAEQGDPFGSGLGILGRSILLFSPNDPGASDRTAPRRPAGRVQP